MILDTLTKLEVILAANVSTTQLDVNVDFIEYGSDGEPTIPAFVRSATNNSTAVTILAAPVSPSKAREPVGVSIYNADVVSAIAAIRTNIATSTRIIVRQTLAAGESLIYEKKGGWQIL